MSAAIVIMPAVGNDVREIQQVLFETWLATYPNEEYGITEDDIRHRFEGTEAEEVVQKRKHIVDCPRRGAIYLVARDDEHIVGACFAHRGEACNELTVLYVLPAYHGTGIGYALWQAALAHLDAAHDTTVRVVKYNRHAIAFYTRLGFELYGIPDAREFIILRSGAVMSEIEMLLPGRA